MDNLPVAAIHDDGSVDADALLASVAFAQPLGERARDQVERAAGGEADDEANGALGGRGQARRRQHRRDRGQAEQPQRAPARGA